MKSKITVFSLIKVIFLLLVVALTLFPFIYMISVSLSESGAVMRNEVLLYPRGINLNMYKYVLSDERIYTAYMNTIIYVVTGTCLALISTAAGAYAATRKRMLFRKLYIKLVVVCMVFNGGMIPTYLVVKQLGLIDHRAAVVLPAAVNMSLFVIMMSLFSSLSTELEDSAKIDGLGDLGVFWYIALPLSKAALATIGLFYAVNFWNDFMTPMIYLNDHKKYPLTILLREMILAGSDMANRGQTVSDGEYVVVDSLKYATLVVSVLPIMCVYPFLQKYFVKGVMVGSLKG